MAGVDRLRLSDLLKIHLLVDLDPWPQDEKSFLERESAFFAHVLTTQIPQDKKHTDDQNQNIFQKILRREIMKVTFCHSSCQRSDELYWSPYFSAPSPPRY